MSDRPEDSLLALTLDAALPFKVREYESQGGPGEWDYERVRGDLVEKGEAARPTWQRGEREGHLRAYADVLAEKGDVLQYGGRKGQAAAVWAVLLDGLAVMSFCPGGVRFCGRRWLASSGWPYWVCDRCETRHAGPCPGGPS